MLPSGPASRRSGDQARQGRLRILKILEVRSLCVCEITDLIGLATSTISSHLNVLKNAGLIKEAKDGKWINYRFVEKPDPFFEKL